jgi:hypothetical protein
MHHRRDQAQSIYEAKLAEGKRKMVAIGHCMAKLVRIIWAVQTYKEPFDVADCARLAAVCSFLNAMS